MAAELKDGRHKLTTLAWVYVEAEHRASGADHSAIVRAVMHEWAEKKHRASIEAQRLLKAEGISGNLGEDGGREGRR